MTPRSRFGGVLALLLLCAAMAVTAPEVFALIVGGEGNSPVGDPGWPAGAAVIFNTPARVAWWEGPPLGGGQWHAECQGDAKVLSELLAKFAKLDAKSKQVVVHDGVGRSVWVKKAKIDWTFMVWQQASWQRLRKLPAELNPLDSKDAAGGPPAQIDVYTGGKVKWADVVVPRRLKIVDNRLEARGFTPADGVVLEGTVTDLLTHKPLVTARMRLEHIKLHPKGSAYIYTKVAQAATDIAGRWVLKKTPAGWHRVVIEADGFVPRAVGYVQVDDQPRWQAFDGGLARPAHVAGRVTDGAGQPLANVEVRIEDTMGYGSPLPYTFKTGADGRFRVEQLPAGQARIWLHKPGYCRPGLGPQITTPADGIELSMVKASRIVVTVDFTGKKRPAGYMVHIEPKGGEAVGKYGGSGNIDPKSQMIFENVPPGEYVIRGRPNPSSGNQDTDAVMVNLKDGNAVQVKVTAK